MPAKTSLADYEPGKTAIPGVPTPTPTATPTKTPSAPGTVQMKEVVVPAGGGNSAPRAYAPATPNVSRMQKAMIDIRAILHGTDLFNPKVDIKDSNTVKDNHTRALPGQTLEMQDDGSLTEPGEGNPVEKFLSSTLTRLTPAGFGKAKNQVSNFKPWGIINRVETIGNVGKLDRQGNPTPDGAWGPKTTAALTALTEALSAIAGLGTKLNIGKDSIPQADINLIQKAIPKDLTNSKDVNDKAGVITSALKDIQDKLDNFLARIKSTDFENETLNSSFDAGYKPKAQADYTNVPGFISHVLVGLKQDTSGKGAVVANLPLSSLSNMQAFQKFVQDNNITVDGQSPFSKENISDPTLVNKLLDHIKASLASGELKLSNVENTALQPQAYTADRSAK